MQKEHTRSSFSAVLDCNDCGEHAEFNSNDIRQLLFEVGTSGWAGDDIMAVTTNGLELDVTVMICRRCVMRREEERDARRLATIQMGGSVDRRGRLQMVRR